MRATSVGDSREQAGSSVARLWNQLAGIRSDRRSAAENSLLSGSWQFTVQKCHAPLAAETV